MFLGHRVLIPCALLSSLALGCSDSSSEEEPRGAVLFIGLSGAPEPPRMTVGEEGFLHAVTYDHNHQIITGVPIAWSSADTSVASVASDYGDNAWAHFTAKRAGTTLITATADGAHASLQLSVVILPVASVAVTPDTTGLVIGMADTLTATLYDSVGRVLTGRPVAWTSSNPGVATVTPSGTVTARGSGAATITATSEGKAGEARIVGVPRPTADWSAVTEDWTTFQGNVAHTGFVPATVDPVIFARRWEVIAEPLTGLNPAVSGAGLVYVSTLAYFGAQKLHALDAATGRRLWSHDFGGIHSVNPPSFNNGAVYVSTGGHEDSFLWSFQASDGVQRFKTPYENQWSRSGAPLIVGSSVFMSGGYYGGMYSFSTTDGAQQWFVQSAWEDGVNPAAGGGLLYTFFGPGGSGLTALETATGAAAFDIGNQSFGTTTLSPSGHVLSTQGDGRLTSFDIASRAVAWTYVAAYRNPVAVANGVLYVLNGPRVEAHSESNGTLLWEWGVPGDPGYLSRTMVITKNILFVSYGTATYALDLTAHIPVWTYPAGGWLSLTKDGLLLIAREDGTLTAISVK